MDFKKYVKMVKETLNKDKKKGFEASVSLAKEVGVDETKILKTTEEIDKFFLE